ncbi:phage tail tape measure protein [Actinacidiphila acididurans]|uniref:phage tail tape measure protein n=1 Tax=Actinacidiphila acididurans TaxID=2784346 RepID=UPI0027DBCFD8|nr:phage tail tape measure protein [Actinacidiphila acididurans]
MFIEFLGSASGFHATARGVRTELAAVEREGGGNMARLGAVSKAALAGIGVAAGVAVAKTVHMAADFQQQMVRVRTGAGELAKNMATVSRGVLQMAGEVGQSTEQLTAGLYTTESAGYHGADALKVLETAAKGAKVGNAELATVTDAATTALNAYHLKASDVTAVMNALVATEASGKTNMEALAGSMASILPVASAAHVGLYEVLGAMATMTAQGTSADVAATYLRQTIGQLSNPTAKAAQTMRGLGLDANKVALNLGKRGLASTFDMLTTAIEKKMGPSGTVLISTLQKASKHTSEYQKTLAGLSGSQKTYIGALATMVGGTKSMMGALELTGAHSKTFAADVDTITSHVRQGGKEVEGWSDVQGTFNQKMAEVKGSLQAVGIEIGTVLLPYATQAVGIFAQGVAWMTRNRTAAIALGGAVGGILAIGLVAAAVAAVEFTGALLANPITWIVIGIMAVVAGLALLVTHWRQTTAWIRANIPGLAHFFTSAWRTALALWHVLWSNATKAVQVLVKWFDRNVLVWLRARVGELVKWWHAHSQELAQVWAAVWTLITTYVSVAWRAIRAWLSVLMDTWRVVWAVIGDATKLAWSVISGVITYGMHMIENVVGLILDIITGRWSRVWGDLKKLATQAITDLVSVLGKLVSGFGTLLYDAGKELIRGFINGIKSMGHAVTGAVSDVAHGAVHSVTKILDIGSPSRVFHAIGVFVAEGFIQGLTGSQAKVASAARRMAELLYEAFGPKKQRGLQALVRRDGVELEQLAKQRDTIATRLKAANSRLAGLQKEWTDTRNNVAQGIMQGVSLVTQAGDNGLPLSAADVVNNMRAQVQSDDQFAANLQRLRKMGLRSDLIQQLADAGVDQGGETAQALSTASRAQIKQLNASQKQLLSSANATGSTVADAMYGAGIKSAQGLVRGLESQESNIKKMMLRIAKSMQTAIKDALHIHSPSQVFHEIGQWIASGLANGIDAGRSLAAGASVRLAQAVTGTAAPRLSLAGAGAGAPVVHHVHIEVHGSVRTDRDLRDVVQQEMLRFGGRNPATWPAYSR